MYLCMCGLKFSDNMWNSVNFGMESIDQTWDGHNFDIEINWNVGLYGETQIHNLGEKTDF